jgi:hypothetical protein
MGERASRQRVHAIRARAIGALLTLGGAIGGCASPGAFTGPTVRAFGAPRAERAHGQRTNRRVSHPAVDGVRGHPTGIAPLPSEAPAERAAALEPRVDRPAPPAELDGIEERTTPVSGTDVQAGVAVGEIDAPFARVAATLQDWGSLRLFLPRISESRAVRRRRAESDVYLRADLPEGFGSIWVLARFRVERASGSLVLEGTRVDGTLRRFDLRIEVNEIVGTDRTRVAVRLLGLPPFPLPSSYLTRQHGRWTGRALRALRDRVESMHRAADRSR